MPSIIALKSYGEGRTSVDFGTLVATLVTRYNYSAQCWCLDILDSVGEPLASGLMLVPGVDLIKPFPALKEQIGALVLFEKMPGAYQGVDNIGVTTKLVWFAVGEEVALR